MAKRDLDTLAKEILELESETFELSDYSDATEIELASSTSTCSSTTSTTSCSA